MRSYSFVQVDVFSERPLEGNPLAVFTDARGLSDSEMQALAREMNLSETTYVLPRDAVVERERGVRVRIFTTEEELPFAGHPTLGTAMVLRSLSTNDGSSSSVTLDLNVGKIPVEFRKESDGRVFGEMRQRDPEFGEVHSPEEIARLASLNVGELDARVPIQTVSTGVPFTIIPLRGLASLRRLHLDLAKVAEYAARHDARLLYFVTRDTEDATVRLRARMIFSGGDDPATGSGAGCTAAWMARYGIAQPDESVVIEQGIEAKRPSRIFVRVGVEGERVTNVRVGGYVAEVLRGEVRL